MADSNQYFPGGSIPRMGGVNPDLVGVREDLQQGLRSNERQRLADEQEAAWLAEIQRQEEQARREAVSRSVDEQAANMRAPVVASDAQWAAARGQAPSASPETVDAAPAPPVEGPPLEPLQEELPTVAADVPPSPEEVRINPYTGQPFKTTQDTRGWEPQAVNPFTGQVMDPYAKVYGEQTLLGGLVTAAPSVAWNPNAETVKNPYADSSLTPEEQSRQATIQKAAREKAARDKQAEASKMFGAKWAKAKQYLADPLASPESKQQVMAQMQRELEQQAQPSPLDAYTAAMSESSVDVQAALAKDTYRKLAVARGATPEVADAIAGQIGVEDGRVNYALAERTLDRVNEDFKEGAKAKRDQDKDIKASRTAMLEAANLAAQTKSEDHIALYRGLVSEYEAKFGSLPGPVVDPKQGFSFSGEIRRIFGDPSRANPKTPATPQGDGVVNVRTQSDIDRAKLLIQQARDRGDRNFVIRLRDPNTGVIKTMRAF